ncbi:MAG: hypothetical protein ACTHNU_16875 [Gaiellales bacterium]|jgi:hypothetical protein
MNPRIDTVDMSSDGHHATVSGPINWDTDETSATFAAAIGQMQNGQLVFASGQNATVFTRANDQRWQTQVSTLNGNKLVLGPADGWATAAVLEATGSWECYPWQVDGLTVTEGEVVVSARH